MAEPHGMVGHRAANCLHMGHAPRYNRESYALCRMSREHGEDGKYIETIPPERVLDVFDMVDGPVILSTDVVDALGCSGETARRKLQQLHDRGELERRKVSRRVLYWRPDTGDEGTDSGFSLGELCGDPDVTLADDING